MASWKKLGENKYRLIAEDRIDGKLIRKTKNVTIEEVLTSRNLTELAMRFEFECFPEKLARYKESNPIE
ncbi:hypothetical protein [Paenibacillus sp. BAC0078]